MLRVILVTSVVEESVFVVRDALTWSLCLGLVSRFLVLYNRCPATTTVGFAMYVGLLVGSSPLGPVKASENWLHVIRFIHLLRTEDVVTDIVSPTLMVHEWKLSASPLERNTTLVGFLMTHAIDGIYRTTHRIILHHINTFNHPDNYLSSSETQSLVFLPKTRINCLLVTGLWVSLNWKPWTSVERDEWVGDINGVEPTITLLNSVCSATSREEAQRSVKRTLWYSISFWIAMRCRE
jgi:hypothetical protein